MRNVLALAVLAALFATACGGVDFEPGSHVTSVRVLGTHANQSYAQPGADIELEALAFDGRKEQPEPMTLYWFPTPCIDPANDGYFQCYPALAQPFAPGVDLTPQLTTGTQFAFQLPPDIITSHRGQRGDVEYGLAVAFMMACAGHVEAVPIPAGSGVDAMPFGCFNAQEQRLGPDSYVFTYSSVFAFTDRANQNPALDGLTWRGAPIDPALGITLPHCTQAAIDDCPTTPLDVRVPVSSQELDPGNRDADGNVLKEQIWAAYYVTGGKVKNDIAALYDPRAGKLSSTANDFHAPQTAGDYLLWVVVHDNRGGAAWLQTSIHAQ